MAIKVSGTEVISDDKRILNNEDLPDIRPSLLLDFANSKTLDPRITFTRGSTATYWDGKTTAKAEENLLKYSQDITGTGWADTDANLTANTTTAPDGTTTADTLAAAGTANVNVRKTDYVSTNISQGTYTASIYAKSNGKDFIVLAEYLSDGSLNKTWFNLSTGAVGTTASGHTAVITDAGNSWYRCSITFTMNSTRPGNIVYYLADTDNSTTIVNDSTGIYIWGAQLEQRSSATAYTATTSSPIVKYQPVLQTAASGEARFDHDPVTGESKGLLIEEARTNSLTRSEEFDHAEWVVFQSTITTDTVVAPDGTLTGTKFTPNTTSGEHFADDSLTQATGTFTDSVFAKDGGYKHLILRPVHIGADEGGSQTVRFDLSTGTVQSSPLDVTATIEDVGNGWYRCSMSYTVTGTLSGSYAFRIQVHDDSYNSIFSGDGYSGIYIWGAQREVGSFPTSYIPTSGSTVTRAVEQVTMSDIASELNGQEGTLYVEATPPNYTTGDQRLVSIGSSHSNVVEMFREYGSTNFFFAIRHAGTTISQGSTAWTADTTAKAVIGYKSGDIGFAADGALIMTNTGTFAGMEMNQMLIGRTFQGGASAWSGEIKKIAYYPQKFTNATLQAMTEA